MLADYLSFKTWDSLATIVNYLSTGKRGKKSAVMNIGNTKITPPLINFYMTPKGSFYNLTSIINPEGENPVEVGVGTNVNFIGDGKANTLKFGGQYNNLKLRENLAVSPFIYLNLDDNDFSYQGVSTGFETGLDLTRNLTLTGKLEYNRKDIIENTIKGKDNGHEIKFGFEYRF